MAGNDLLEAARQIGRQDNLAPGLAATGGLRRGVWAKMPHSCHCFRAGRRIPVCRHSFGLARQDHAGKSDLAMFNLAIGGQLGSCDLVRLKIVDVCASGRMRDRATVVQKQAGPMISPFSGGLTRPFSSRCRADAVPQILRSSTIDERRCNSVASQDQFLSDMAH
jgi:hypothetical protein